MSRYEQSIFAPNLFSGQRIIVTGAGGEIGSVIAHGFASLGAHVLLIGRTEEKLAAILSTIKNNGGSAEIYVGDIRDADWVDDTVKELADAAPPIASLVNCAGGQYAQPAIDISPKGWRAVIDTNLTGTWLMTQAMARKWMERGEPGSITQIILTYFRGLPGMAHSVAARAGVEAFSRTVAIEWARMGIRVNCVAPGLIDTHSLRGYGDGVIARLQEVGNPMRRLGSPAEIASACIYLASPLSSFITGTTLSVDGGQALWGDNWTIDKPDEGTTGAGS